MKKLLFFGDGDAPYFNILNEASHLVEWVDAWPLGEFKTQLQRHRGEDCVPILLGCNYPRFNAFYNEVIVQEKYYLQLMAFESRGLVLCDFVKPFWKQFVKDTAGVFSRLYPIDMPNGLISEQDIQIFSPIVGMPIGHWLNACELQPERMQLLSFAGTTHIYPERQRCIDSLIQLGIQVALLEPKTANPSHFDQYRNVDYRRYLDLLLHSTLTLNFPQATSGSGGGLHIKGRYWEAMATGSILLEQHNSMCELMSPRPQIINYIHLEEIAVIVARYRERSKSRLIEEKRSQIAELKGLFDASAYFDQFLS